MLFPIKHQDSLEADIMLTRVAVENTCVYLTTQSTISIVTAGRIQPTSMELSMKWVPLIRLQITYMTMMQHAPCATSDRVVRNWWCPRGTIVQPVGLKSIMAIWWLNITITRYLEILSALIGRLSMFQAPNLVKMVRCCILWKGFAARYHASLTFVVESWHAQCVPSKGFRFHRFAFP